MFRFFEGYSKEELPLGPYAALVGLYTVLFGGLGALLARRRRLPRPGPFDVLLLGLATHKLTRLIARDWVTSPFRAPFTQYQSSESGGEVNERSRGAGFRRAVGDLITCPFCTGPWVAAGLGLGFAASPPRTRLLAAVFASVTISDFLHRSYETLGEKEETLGKRVELLRRFSQRRQAGGPQA